MFAAYILIGSVYASGYNCATGIVDKISVGYRNFATGFIVSIDNKLYPVNSARDLKTSSGYALLQLLLYSKSTGTPVQLWDHIGNCESFDEVALQ